MIYLASPYSHPSEEVRVQRFDAVCKKAASMMRQGLFVFSPIAHTHPIAAYGLPKGWEFWEKYDRMFLQACHKVVVLMLDGWRDSVGVQAEIKIAEQMGMEVEYMEAD